VKTIHQNQTAEWSFTSAKSRRDPFNEVELSAGFEGEDGEKRLVPAFWAGGRTWRVRFSSPAPGKHHFRTVCTDPSDSGLHGQEGDCQVRAYAGSNPLYRHGPIRVAASRRHFEHADGTPFFWLGDTWWMGLCKRLAWPAGFRKLAADRVRKGFSVVQIVAGLYPDMPAFDRRGANEAGFPWEKDYSRINPAYFNAADRRIAHLVASGLVPCLVGCWGYFLPWMGVEKMKRHWRNLVARYGSYPVVWCLAGEGTMPYYLAPNKEADSRFQKKGWTELARYVREIDPYRHPVTIHPSASARSTVEDPAVLDFDMLQTGHSDRGSLHFTVRLVSESYRTTPVMPAVDGEVCYEGIGGCCGPEVQRMMFWACFLNGAGGYTYGANGIWQVNTRAKPYGPSPHGMSWGDAPWEDAHRLAGSGQVGLAKRFLSRYPWWQFQPHPEWVEPHWTDDLFTQPFACGRHDRPMAAGIPGRVRIIYLPMGASLKKVNAIEKGVRYGARLFNPVDGSEQDMGEIQPDAPGDWVPTFPGLPAWFPLPIYQDWVLALEARE
jgi:hypothetical protein